jgi:hypothetical protein
MLVAQQFMRNLKHNQQAFQQLIQTNPTRLQQVIQELLFHLSHAASHRVTASA